MQDFVGKNFLRLLRIDLGPVRLAKKEDSGGEQVRSNPKAIMIKRGGNDFFSGTMAGSRTLTLGISLASSILASSNC